MTKPARTLLLTAAAAILLAAVPALADPGAADQLHGRYDQLLQRHVRDLGVDYAAWHRSEADRAALARYVDELTALDPAGWPRADRLTYWLNLYNAVTLRLILDHYPLDSIRDLGGFLKKSPWKRDLVTVGGRDLTLDNIEHDIIRPEFGDARIHFAVNCAAIGCPPLHDRAFRAAELDAQLDLVSRLAVNHPRWVRVDGDGIRVTKIFEWYGDDFETDGASVRTFIDRFRDEPLPDGKIEYLEYDWSLNQVD